MAVSDRRRLRACHGAKAPLSSAPYAKGDRAQQDSKVSLETIQDHRDGQSDAATCFAQASPFLEERQAQAPHGQVEGRGQDGHVSHQVEHAVRLIAEWRFATADPSCSRGR